MENNIRKYLKFILVDCLKMTSDRPLLIVGDKIIIQYMDMMKEEALKLGIHDIAYQMKDSFAMKEMYLHSSLEECIKSPLFDRSLFNIYALKNGAIVSMTSPIPGINDGVDVKKLNEVNKYMQETIKPYRERQEQGLIPWCIFGVPNEFWASDVLPDSENPEEELWNFILDICYMKEENPSLVWQNHFEKLAHTCRTLNDMKIKYLHYESENGTDITFQLPENYSFASAQDSEWIVNMPSLEVFATPFKTGVNGIVYSTKPLLLNGVIIPDFNIRFENGRVEEVHASEQEALLKEYLMTDEGASYLGEVALVSYDSKINLSGLLFKETLFDENASCHLAFGRGFRECFQNGYSLSNEELEKSGLNNSKIHCDFMVGSRDLKITAILKNGEEKLIMEQGNLII